jgi:2-polyprenyl-3-methyl-5-hydroxy-6-metoxy-1,4-benzoquinol methylase
MKYYYPENIERYREIEAAGKAAWAEILASSDFQSFPSRTFLEEVLPGLKFPLPNPTVLEYGCGTGPGACFLAQRGFQVDAIDIIPAAIEVAREIARQRSLDIHYEVQDVCELSHEGKQYDMIVDSYCLQHIVTDEDREKVFSAVRARLKPGGYYLVSTAMFDEARFHEQVRIRDERTGKIYQRYDEDELFDPETSVVYVKLGEWTEARDSAVSIAGEWYLPNRKHHKAPALRGELQKAGFKVLYQDDGYGGNVVCTVENPAQVL